MSGWWQQRYERGDPIAVPGFPRPLYPPDANKYGQGRGSVDGADVLAYKRWAWRLGRWAGPASRFDDSYSNGFAHGTGGDVIETGLAGCQRQGGISDTGWIGLPTFELVLSALIPSGFDGPGKAGEYALDAYGQSLLVQAWDEFGGKEPPPPPPTKTLRQKAYELALTQIGTKESPPNSNVTPYTQWYGAAGPWCAMFVTWCFEQAGGSPSFVRGVSYAYVPTMVNDARAKRNGLSVTSSPVAGDCVAYDWQGSNDIYDHVGIFEEWTGASTFSAIEGNTAVGNDSDGGEVMRRQRDAKAQSTVFMRVAEP